MTYTVWTMSIDQGPEVYAADLDADTAEAMASHPSSGPTAVVMPSFVDMSEPADR